MFADLIKYIKAEKIKTKLPDVKTDFDGYITVELQDASKVSISHHSDKYTKPIRIIFDRDQIPVIIKKLFDVACKTSGEPVSGC